MNYASNKRIVALARDKFRALPDFYSKPSDKYRYTNMDDAVGSVKQEEWICIARAIRDGDNKLAGDILSASLMNVCVKDATNEIEESEDD